MFKRIHLIVLILAISSYSLLGQSLPENITFSADNNRLTTKKNLQNNGLYSLEHIPELYLTFEQPNWWQLLTQNYTSNIDIPADLTYNDNVYKNVGVRFRGQTSYDRVQNSQKKSFNITIDYEDENQEIEGYETLNLNNCYADPSFMREVLYSVLAGENLPIAKANFVKLFINGESWGLYSNVQQLNRDFYKEWFFNANGANWRAEYPDTSSAKPKPGVPGSIPGSAFGAGFCSLNDLGSNPIRYSQYYTLKSSRIENTWEVLANACQKLASTPTEFLYDSLGKYIDVDRAIWHIATEIVFTDEDSYVNKGGMDYYVYYDDFTNRLQPIIYDGNSTFLTKSVNWSAFLKENDTKFPLINRLLANPQLKQRYVAHLRTILDNIFNDDKAIALIDRFDALIRSEVEKDTKKLYTYTQYINSINELKNFIRNRRTILRNQSMINAKSPIIHCVSRVSNIDNSSPKVGESIKIQARITSENSVSNVILYFGTGLSGHFQTMQMTRDESQGNDYFIAEIPAIDNPNYIRYYVEATADNTFRTATFSPESAEHDVYILKVEPQVMANSSVVINELIASNSSIIKSPLGEYSDWIELYNRSEEDVNLSGMFLSDKLDNPRKWQFPQNTIIKAGEYLIVWADGNAEQAGGLHTNFSLSANGEAVILSDIDANGNRLLDTVVFGALGRDIAYGRFPNGTGSFTHEILPTPGSENKLRQPIPQRKIKVVINELMASNSTNIRSPLGDYADWIELFNIGNEDVDLGGMFLSDNLNNPRKWKFPQNTIIKAGGYLLVWADSKADIAGGLHTNYNLSADGEVLILSDTDEYGNNLLDTVVFGALNSDVAYGRLPNGTGSFTTLIPTPNAVNKNEMGNDSNYSIIELSEPFPNPATVSIQFSVSSAYSGKIDVSIYDILGRKVAGFNNQITENHFEWNLHDLEGNRVRSGTFIILVYFDNTYVSKSIIVQ